MIFLPCREDEICFTNNENATVKMHNMIMYGVVWCWNVLSFLCEQVTFTATVTVLKCTEEWKTGREWVTTEMMFLSIYFFEVCSVHDSFQPVMRMCV